MIGLLSTNSLLDFYTKSHPKEAPRASFFLAKGVFTFGVGCDIIKMFIAVDLFVKDALKHIPIAAEVQTPEI